MPANDVGIPVAVSARHILFSEISSVTSVMRKNSRWAAGNNAFSSRDSALASNFGLRVSGPSSTPMQATRGSRERDLMAGFHVLKRTVNDVKDLSTLPLTIILAPFLAIIRSPLSTGLITSAALSSLHAFFIAGIISPRSPSIDTALSELSSTVSNCKFEATDSSGDEAVMLKILAVIEACICGSASEQLGDVEVCEMLETVLTTCCQMRLSEILRRSSERTMVAIVRVMSARLHHLDPALEEASLQTVRMTVTAEPIPAPDVGTEVPSDAQSETTVAVSAPDVEHKLPVKEELPFTTYGLPAMVELLRVLINILDPNDKSHTDSIRLVSMRILLNVVAVGGRKLGDFPSLAALVNDHGCKYLFQLARSDNPSVLQLALRLITSIFEVMRDQLKLQQELFIAFTIDRLASPTILPPPAFASRASLLSPRPGTPASTSTGPAAVDSPHPDSPAPSKPAVLPARGETRELLLDMLSQLTNYSSFFVDLYTNYDCDLNCENLFNRLIEFLTQGVYPSPQAGGMEPQLQNSQYYTLEILLTAVNYMSRRAEGDVDAWPATFPEINTIIASKSRKNQATLGATLFNAKPKNGVAFLEENGLIYADLSPEVTKSISLAKFLKSSTRIDKKVLGEYLAKPDNLELLNAFIGLFDFQKKPVAEAVRGLLESFRLPGEAQQISRITETFAEIYFASGPDEIKNQDAVYILAYSIILLNTDLHNPQIRKRMTIDDFRRNLRGQNDGADFSSEFLQNIYDSIRKREIVMPQEHTGQVGFDYAWRELLSRSQQAGSFMMCNTPAFDLDMFKAVWRPLISAIAYAFMSFDDDYVIERAITGFRQCATLAGHFQLPDVFDYVVVTLSQTTSLLSESLPTSVPNYPVVDFNGQGITVSSLSVKFGTNVKGQLAAVVLYNIVNGNGNALREGWTQIFEMFQNLFLHSLLPTRMLQMEDFLGGVSMIPLRGSQPAPRVQRNEGGLLSALSSYLMAPSSDSVVPGATDTDIESTLSTIDCIAACRLDEFYAQIIQLDGEALAAAIRALEALAHERTVARLRQESDENVPSAALPYDPASVFLLETMVSIACQTPQHIDEVWPVIMEHLSALLSTPQQYSILLIERAVVSLLRLGRILATKPNLRDQLYVSFDLIAGLPPTVTDSIAEQIVRGLLMIIQHDKSIVRSQTEWNVIFAVLRGTINHAEAANLTFEFLQKLVAGQAELVTTDNYAGAIMLMDDFASLGGAAADAHARQRRREPVLSAASSPIVERACKAVNMLYELRSSMARLLQQSELFHELKWRQYILPILAGLARQSSNASREARLAAMTHLQRLILGPAVSIADGDQRQIEELFSRVVFPLVDELLKPQVAQRDPPGMSETRLRASTLLCKAFMHFEVREGSDADIRLLWIQVLDLLDRLMKMDSQDQLHEAVPESLKNVVLVMNAAGILVPPSAEDQRDDRQKAIWAATHERIERFLPHFLEAVLPAPPPPEAPTPQAPPVQSE